MNRQKPCRREFGARRGLGSSYGALISAPPTTAEDHEESDRVRQSFVLVLHAGVCGVEIGDLRIQRFELRDFAEAPLRTNPVEIRLETPSAERAAATVRASA